MKHFLQRITLSFWAITALNLAAVLVGWAGPETFALPHDLTKPISASMSYTAAINLILRLYLFFEYGISK